MKINRFNQFVKNRINEDVDAIETPEEFENEEGTERTEEIEDEDNPNIIDDVDQDLNDNVEDDEFDDSEEEFGSEETMPRQRTIKSYNDFESEDEESEDEFPGGEWSEDSERRDPDEDYIFSEEEDQYEGEEEESGDYKGEVEMKRLADMLGTEVVNNQIEFEGKKINYYSETEKFHVGKKKFETPEEVVDYLESESDLGKKMTHDEHEEDHEDPKDMAMESRRFTRRRFK